MIHWNTVLYFCVLSHLLLGIPSPRELLALPPTASKALFDLRRRGPAPVASPPFEAAARLPLLLLKLAPFGQNPLLEGLNVRL
jgi:hypothetical protein